MSDALSAAVGWSWRSQAEQAGEEAAHSALARWGGRAPTCAVLFGSSWFDQTRLLNGVRSVVGGLPLIGASTAGEIGPQGPASHSCVVLLVASDAIACSVGLGEHAVQAPREAGQQAAAMALRTFGANRRVALVAFGDGFLRCASDVVRGLQEVLGTSFLIAGGLAGDDLRFARTHQYADDRAVSESIVGLLVGGAVKLGVGIEHGFIPISKPRRITRARANILLELDHRPAAAVYAEYLGRDLARGLRADGLLQEVMAYPLGLSVGPSSRWLLRNVAAVGEDGSLVCTGDFMEGAWLQVMMSNRELTLEAAVRAAQQAIRPLARVACALMCESVVCRKLLGVQQAATAIVRIRQILGAATPLAGCVSYGELLAGGAGAAEQAIVTHTGSVLVLAIGE
jgi:hypothetical protein